MSQTQTEPKAVAFLCHATGQAMVALPLKFTTGPEQHDNILAIVPTLQQAEAVVGLLEGRLYSWVVNHVHC